MTGQRLKVCFDELNLNHSYSYCMSAVQRYKTVVTDKLVLCENTRAEHFDRRSVFYCYSAWFLWSCWDWKKIAVMDVDLPRMVSLSPEPPSPIKFAKFCKSKEVSFFSFLFFFFFNFKRLCVIHLLHNMKEKNNCDVMVGWTFKDRI